MCITFNKHSASDVATKLSIRSIKEIGINKLVAKRLIYKHDKPRQIRQLQNVCLCHNL